MIYVEVHEGRGVTLKVTGKVGSAKWVPYTWILLQTFPPEAGSRSTSEIKLYIESPEVLQKIAKLATELAKGLRKRAGRGGDRRRLRGQCLPAR